MSTFCKLALLAAALGLTTACAPPGSPYEHAHNGALAGAAAGAVIGHQLDDRNGAVAGGLAGAVIGGSVGSQMDYRERYEDPEPYYRRDRRPPQDYRDYGPPPGYDYAEPY